MEIRVGGERAKMINRKRECNNDDFADDHFVYLYKL